jgi:hypothetical protein
MFALIDRRRAHLFHASCSGFALGPAGGLEQLRINCESHLHRVPDNVAGGSADGFGERALQPLLKEMVRDADHQEVVVPGKLRVRLKPELVAWLPDALDKCLLQRGHDLAVAGRHGFSPGA